MSTDFDYDLSLEQWEALRALRGSASRDLHVKSYLVEDLIKLGLVTTENGALMMTPTGRKVLVRGSCRLLDLAA